MRGPGRVRTSDPPYHMSAPDPKERKEESGVEVDPTNSTGQCLSTVAPRGTWGVAHH